MASIKTFILVLFGIFFVLSIFVGVWIYKIYTSNMAYVNSGVKNVDCVGYIYSISDSTFDASANLLTVAVTNANYAETELKGMSVTFKNITQSAYFSVPLMPGESSTVKFNNVTLINNTFKINVYGCAKKSNTCKLGQVCS